jgi:DNA replication and repair protein RecF
VEVTVDVRQPKEVRLNGAVLRSAEALRGELTTLVFTPDRLAVAKGGPAVRRAYLDRALGRLLPARATVPAEYASALAQRNALLRAIATARTTADALSPWTAQVARLGTELVRARRDAAELLGPGFAAAAAELGLADARLEYDADAPTAEALDARLARDLERGTTGIGPHLDDPSLRAGRRDLRAYGSQGEQRIAVLALLLAEAELLAERRARPALVLLDDVLSELDAGRRRSLGARIARFPQAVVTTTGPESLPLDPDQLLEVSPGHVRVAA